MFFDDSDSDFQVDSEDYDSHTEDIWNLSDHDREMMKRCHQKEYEINHMKRCKDICAGLLQARSKGLFCDANIIVEGKKFEVNRTVLMASSSYFSIVFTGDFFEKNESEIHIRGISSGVFAVLLDYMYGAKISLTFENVKEIYRAGDMLCIDALTTDCKNYITNNWELTKDLESVFEMTKEFGMKEMTKNIIRQGRTDLKNLSRGNGYRELSDTFLLTILEGRNTMKYLMREGKLAEYLLEWAYFKPDERLPIVAEKVFATVRFDCITREEFLNILFLICSPEKVDKVSSEVRASFVTCLEDMYKLSHQRLIDQHVTIILSEVVNDSCGNFRLNKFNFQNWEWELDSCEISDAPRAFITNKDDLFVFTKEGCTKLNLQTKQTLEVPNFPTKRTKSVFSLCGDDVYVAGGYKDGTNESLDEILKLSNEEWRRCVVWRKAKSKASSITYGQSIYFVGGTNVSSGINDQTECLSYNTTTSCFKKICNLNFPAICPKLAIYNDVLYIFSSQHLHSDTSIVQGVDLKCNELIPESAFVGLELKYPIFGVTSVSAGLLIAYLTKNKISFCLYKPNEDQPMEFLCLIGTSSLEYLLYGPIEEYRLLFGGQSSASFSFLCL